jgi:hypothetical protein
MKSEALGLNTLAVEVSNISRHGIWVLVGEEELFLPFSEFPWFRDAPVSAILNIELSVPDHLYWPDIDVDLTVDSIRHPERYPLVSKGTV